MKEELEKKLVKKYPKIFTEYKGDPAKTCMSWGMETGDGWFQIIDTMCGLLDNHADPDRNSSPGPQVVASQVKEKFGCLHFYTNGCDDYQDGVIAMAESMSYKTCEVCGMPGKRRGGGWIRTLCDACYKEDK